MKREYWVDKIIGKLYGVKWSDGTLTHTAFEGTEDDCWTWIKNNR